MSALPIQGGFDSFERKREHPRKAYHPDHSINLLKHFPSATSSQDCGKTLPLAVNTTNQTASGRMLLTSPILHRGCVDCLKKWTSFQESTL